ncbi:hypothetical protein [Nonomuraea sp. NPDC050310]|uniref:hypothetical protein n=1 Tax=Nonomuraea sp. NPDC050310 TaxID=3154935 RepID=UPI0033F2EA11
MTAGTTGSSSSEVEFDPDATGVIPRITDADAPARDTTSSVDAAADVDPADGGETADGGASAEGGDSAGGADSAAEDSGDGDVAEAEDEAAGTIPRAVIEAEEDEGSSTQEGRLPARPLSTKPPTDGPTSDTPAPDAPAADAPAAGRPATDDSAADAAAGDEGDGGEGDGGAEVEAGGDPDATAAVVIRPARSTAASPANPATTANPATAANPSTAASSAVTGSPASPASAAGLAASAGDTDSTVTHRIRPAAQVRVGSGPQAPHAIPGGAATTPGGAPAVPHSTPAVPQGTPAVPSGPEDTQVVPRRPAQASLGTRVAPRETGQPKAGRMAKIMAAAPHWLPALLMIEGVVMYVLALKLPPGPLRGVRPEDIDGLGLISALPLSAFAAILIMIVSFFITVNQSVDRKFLLLFQIAAITFALHGAGALVGDEPRFPTAYVHAGFVDFINRTGEASINIDARMGWPGFFTLFAFVTRTAGITDLTTILQWTPLVMNLLYLLPFVLILRQVVATTRARWYAALLFVIVQWIGQDYFSPQGFTFAIYLVFVAILLRWFGRVEPRVKPLPEKGRLRRLLAKLDTMTPGEIAETGTYRADRLLMLLLLVLLFVAATASHQITPFMMLGVLTAFLLVKRTKLTWGLPFFFGLMVLGWISYQTVGFWAGNIDSIFGGLGRILTNLQRNTGDRIAGSDPEHALVLQVRLGICAAILGLAAVGLLRRLRRGVFDRAALILLCVPVLALGLQSYGGEIGLRIYMFALPGACLLAAYAFFPNLPADSEDARDETIPIRKRAPRFNPKITRMISLGLALVLAMVFSMAFLVARYGNEKFERVTTGEVEAMRYIYAHDKPSARVIYLVPKVGPESTPILPWAEKDLEYINWTLQGLVHKDPTQIADVVAKLKESPRNTFLVATTGQYNYLQLNEGFAPDWGQRFVAALDASKDVKKVFTSKDAAVYVWGKFAKGTEIPPPQPYAGRGDPTSPWTPLGLGAMAVTWMALFGYEVIRLGGPDRAPRARRRLLWIGIPAFVVSIAVIVERFISIAAQNG